MGSVDDGDDAFLDQIAPQPLDAAEAADPDRQVARAGVDGVSRKRDDGADLGRLLGQELVERGCFARSAKDEDGHGNSLA